MGSCIVPLSSLGCISPLQCFHLLVELCCQTLHNNIYRLSLVMSSAIQFRRSHIADIFLWFAFVILCKQQSVQQHAGRRLDRCCSPSQRALIVHWADAILHAMLHKELGVLRHRGAEGDSSQGLLLHFGEFWSSTVIAGDVAGKCLTEGLVEKRVNQWVDS